MLGLATNEGGHRGMSHWVGVLRKIESLYFVLLQIMLRDQRWATRVYNLRHGKPAKVVMKNPAICLVVIISSWDHRKS